MSRDSPHSIAKMLARVGPVLDRLPDGPCAMVEVGVFTGIMAEHLLKARQDLTWHGVDPWHGPENNSEAYRRTGDGHAVQTLDDSERYYRRTVDRLKPFAGRAYVNRAASPSAATGYARHSMAMVFIDADHSYPAVVADIDAWWPVVEPGGWLGGHDIGNTDQRFDFSGVDRAVREFIGRIALELEIDAGATWFVRKLA